MNKLGVVMSCDYLALRTKRTKLKKIKGYE